MAAAAALTASQKELRKDWTEVSGVGTVWKKTKKLARGCVWESQGGLFCFDLIVFQSC